MQKTQVNKIVDYINKNGSITDQEAQIMRVRSLSRRIVDLKEKGYAFNKKERKDDYGQRFVEYSFA